MLDVVKRVWYNPNLRGHVLRILLCPNGGKSVLRDWSSQPKVVGVKQSRRAIREGRAVQVFLATNADPALTGPLAALCAAEGIPVEQAATMEELGKAAGIQVGAAVVAVLRA